MARARKVRVMEDESSTDSDREVKHAPAKKSRIIDSSSSSSSGSDSDVEVKQSPSRKSRVSNSPSSSSGSDSDSSSSSNSNGSLKRSERMQSESETENDEETENEKQEDGGMGMAISDSEDEEMWGTKNEANSDSEGDMASQQSNSGEDTGELDADEIRLQYAPSADSFMGGSEGDTESIADERASIQEIQESKWLLRKFISYVPLAEAVAIRRGINPSGPPIENPVAHADEFARKFRWPQHIRNLRNAEYVLLTICFVSLDNSIALMKYFMQRSFSQDPSEILEDHEVLPEACENVDTKESPFAQVPRPILALAAEALRRLRKHRRTGIDEHVEEANDSAPSPTSLVNIARVCSQFGEQFTESLLSANGKALQGLDGSIEGYGPTCWSTLPMSRKPVANWRFVLQHLSKSVSSADAPDSVACPPMKQETISRITSRIKQHYQLAWQQQDDEFFAAVQSELSAATHASKRTSSSSDENE